VHDSAQRGQSPQRLLGRGLLRLQWDRSHVARAFHFGKWTWAQSIGAALFATADRLLVGSMMGAAALAHYSVCVQLAQQVQTLPAAGAQVLLPRVSRLESEGTHYRAMALRLTLGVGAIAGLAGLVLALLGQWLLQLWVGTAIADETSGTLPLLAVGYAVLGANVVPHYVLLGAGRARFVAVVNIAAGLLAILLAWLLVPTMGFAGAAIGRLCYALVISANVLAMLHQTRHSEIKGAEPA
jgi:O-antigen/teichoic acid export membrane protein